MPTTPPPTPRTHTGQQLAKAIAADYDRALLPDWPDPTGLVLAIETEAAGAALAALSRQPEDLPEPIGRVRRKWWRLGWLSAQAVARSDLGLSGAAPAAPAASALDAAWARLKAVLPDRWVLDLFDYGPPGPFSPGPGEPFHTPRYQASAILGVLSSPPKFRGQSDESPAAALDALAARLANPEKP